MAKLREDGEANFYGVLTDDARDWLAVVQINGELTLEMQRSIMKEIVAVFDPHQKLLTSQGRQ
jgi:hypothetical protein